MELNGGIALLRAWDCFTDSRASQTPLCHHDPSLYSMGLAYGKQFRILIGKTDAEAETPVLWPPDAKNLLIGKDPDARKD